MADNSAQNATDTIRDIDKGGVKTQVTILDVGGAGAESLLTVGQKLAAASLPVVLASDQPALPVTGTFYQSTQPVSIAAMPTTPVTFTWAGLTDTQLRASAVPVSFTWAGLTDTQLRATPVPVSGTVAVTGTFFQATQPVSIAGTVTTNTGLTQPLTDTQLRASVVPVSVSNFPATQNTDVSDRAGRLVGVVTNANIDVALSTRLKPADTLAGVTTVAAVTAITNQLPAGTNKIGTVDIATAPAVAKGTQGANAVPTQDLKDSGRVAISFTAEFSPVAVAEAMLTMSVSKDGATATTTASYVITSGKRLRVASKSIAVENTLGTSIQRAYLRTRFAVTGGAVVASPLQANCIATAAGTVKSTGSNFDDYPDGLEFLGDGTKAIGWSLTAPDWVSATSTLKVYVTIIAFEY